MLPRAGLRPGGFASPGLLTPSGAPGSTSQRTDKPAGPRRPLLASPRVAACPTARWVASAERAPYSEGQCVQADRATCRGLIHRRPATSTAKPLQTPPAAQAGGQWPPREVGGEPGAERTAGPAQDVRSPAAVAGAAPEGSRTGAFTAPALPGAPEAARRQPRRPFRPRTQARPAHTLPGRRLGPRDSPRG